MIILNGRGEADLQVSPTWASFEVLTWVVKISGSPRYTHYIGWTIGCRGCTGNQVLGVLLRP